MDSKQIKFWFVRGREENDRAVNLSKDLLRRKERTLRTLVFCENKAGVPVWGSLSREECLAMCFQRVGD